MEKHHKKLLDELIDMLRRLREFSLMAKFAEKFNEETGGKRPRSFGTRIISGEINFSGSLIDKLVEAHRIAMKLYDEIDAKKKTDAKTVSLKSLIKNDLTMSNLEEQIFLADSFYFKGEIRVSTTIQKVLFNLIDIDKLSYKSSFIRNYLILMHARNLSQFANSKNIGYLLAMVNDVIKSLSYTIDKEPKLYGQALTLKGLILRQSFKFNEATQVFQNLKSFSLDCSLRNEEKIKLSNMSDHQLAITYLKNGDYISDSGMLLESQKLLSTTNTFFSDQENENWYMHCKIREIEAHIKLGSHELVEKMILDICDPLDVSILQNPQQVIYLRLIAEKYAMLNDRTNANRYFEIAIKKARFDGYLHEIELLKRLGAKFKFLEWI